MAKKFKKLAKEIAEEVAALKADVVALKTEVAHLRTEVRAKPKAEIGAPHKKLPAKLERPKQRSRGKEKEAKSKVQALGDMAAKAKGQTKAPIEASVANARNKSPKPATVVEQPQGSKSATALDLNKQEVKGREEQAEGKLRGEAGKKAGDWEEQILGKAQEVKGTVREAVGRTARKMDEK